MHHADALPGNFGNRYVSALLLFNHYRHELDAPTQRFLWSNAERQRPRLLFAPSTKALESNLRFTRL